VFLFSKGMSVFICVFLSSSARDAISVRAMQFRKAKVFIVRCGTPHGYVCCRARRVSWQSDGYRFRWSFAHWNREWNSDVLPPCCPDEAKRIMDMSGDFKAVDLAHVPGAKR
jgi:hypothetical protein